MSNLKAINPALLVNNEMFTFVPFKSVMVDQVDVYYKEQRIAILNGLSAPLKWTAKNGSNIPNNVIASLEKIVRDNIDSELEINVIENAKNGSTKTYEQLMFQLWNS